MSVSYRIFDMPELPVSGQVFYCAGSAVEGGFTSGGVSVFSPEPGGRGTLEIQYSYQIGEWDNPFISWLMSKINGQLLRYRLVPTPQLCVRSIITGTAEGVNWNNLKPWDNKEKWSNFEGALEADRSSLQGSIILYLDMGSYGKALKPGHVIGFKNSSYKIDEVSYQGGIATVTITPPLRNEIKKKDRIQLRPYFVGRIINGDEIKQMYEASEVGNIKPGRIVLGEAIV